MTDFTWPDDLVPYQQLFYLQPHVVRSESPFTRQTKIYGLSAPRWICKMVFRGGYDGIEAQGAYGPRLDAIVAQLAGGANRVAIYDFRRTALRGPSVPSLLGNSAASAAATSMTVTGLSPGDRLYPGDYLGGDGRPHIITIGADADGSGHASVTFTPPLAADIATDAATLGTGAGWFRLTSDDAGGNLTEVGGLAQYDLEFVEDL